MKRRQTGSSTWSYLLAHPLDGLLVAVPLALAARYFAAGDMWVFVASGVAIVPLAGLMGRATESVAARLGSGVGGLINATFGNAAELIIALAALRQGPHMYPLVKASLTGSIIGNVLLVLGLSMLAGGLYHKQQHFNRTSASMGATLLTLATIGLIIPTLYFHAFAATQPLSNRQLQTVEFLSEEIAFILAAVYVLSLIFTFGTHRSLLSSTDQPPPKEETPEWERVPAMIILILATAGVAVMGELLVHSVEHAADVLGMSSIFVGVIVVAIVGNAAEHSTAILVAMKNKMDLSFTIAVGSGIQIALLIAPLLVFASMAIGHARPLDLHFSPMEVVAIAIAIIVLAQVAQDGETHWLEGAMLLAVYTILALAFYHLGEITAPVPAAG
jgi:Ca2+:H+ antiporter